MSERLVYRERLIFLHLVKTGGMTLQYLFQRLYPDEAQWLTDDPDVIKRRRVLITMLNKGQPVPEEGRTQVLEHQQARLENLHISRKALLQVVYGHCSFGIHEALPNDWRYFTLLRDPVDRVLSMYQWRVDRHGLKVTLDQYVDRAQDPWLDNLQTRRVAGGTGVDPDEPVTERTLDVAKENLRTRFIAVGVTERFDASLYLLKKRMAFPDVRYHRYNTTPKRPMRGSVPGAVLSRIEEMNRFDRELHRFAGDLLERDLRDEGIEETRVAAYFEDPPTTPPIRMPQRTWVTRARSPFKPGIAAVVERSPLPVRRLLLRNARLRRLYLGRGGSKIR